MATRDARIDAYIAGAPAFARPILTHLRAVIHQGCPEVEETIKWRMPSFTYHGILCGFAAFKAHCAFGFWRGTKFGCITSVKELPAKRVLVAYVKEAARRNEQGIKGPAKPKAKRKALPLPADLAAGLKKSAKARAEWAEFTPSAQREYIEWITEAKREATRAERLATTLLWVSQGKHRNWKYM